MSEINDAAIRVHKAIERDVSILGPEFQSDDNELPEPAPPLELEEWVLIMNWKDAEGKSYISRATSPGLIRYAENGLLHEALYNFD